MKKYISASSGADFSVIYEDEKGNRDSWSGGTRAWRNNNPGNIRDGEFARRVGAIGAAGGFAVFPDYETGLKALAALLRTETYRRLTLGQAINRYAPPVENDTGAYVGAVEKQTGIPRATILSQLSETQITALAKAIEKHEGYNAGTISACSST